MFCFFLIPCFEYFFHTCPIPRIICKNELQDVEIYWPTAAGKSLIYQLVALLSWKRKRGIVIVVEPTIPVKQEGVLSRGVGSRNPRFNKPL